MNKSMAGPSGTRNWSHLRKNTLTYDYYECLLQIAKLSAMAIGFHPKVLRVLAPGTPNLPMRTCCQCYLAINADMLLRPDLELIRLPCPDFPFVTVRLVRHSPHSSTAILL
jgi:hypothetical protein